MMRFLKYMYNQLKMAINYSQAYTLLEPGSTPFLP